MKIKASFKNLRFSVENFAILISILSLVISAVGFYINTVRPPNISVITAPYIKHVVDNASLNEAFFVPLTLVNQGAQTGTVLSFDLNVTNRETGETRTYYGQYFAQDDAPTELGAFFTPITLDGYSSASYTVCFYPIGSQAGNLFSGQGDFDFEVVGKVSNVAKKNTQTRTNAFHISVDESMANVMASQPDGEYIYPLKIEATSTPENFLLKLLYNYLK